MENNYKKSSLEEIYSYHHRNRRGWGFLVLGEERGHFLKEKIGKNKKILDLGCRDGSLSKFYYKNNDVLGADIDGEALQMAKKNLNIKIKQMDLNGVWDLPDNYFDVVVAAEVIEHLYYPEKVLDKIAGVLKNDGVFLGSVPNAFSLKNRIRLFFGRKRGTTLEDPTHINHFLCRELNNLLKKYFSEVKIYPMGRFAFLDKFFPGMFSFMIIFEVKHKKPDTSLI